MALVLISSVSQGAMGKGLLAGLLGVLVSMPGVDPSTGHSRLTWDWYMLNGAHLTFCVCGREHDSELAVKPDRTVEPVFNATAN